MQVSLSSSRPIATQSIASLTVFQSPSIDRQALQTTVIPTQPVETEPNDTIATAQLVDLSLSDNFYFLSEAFSGNNFNIAPNLDVDLFKIQLNANEQLVVRANASNLYPPPVPIPAPEPAPSPRPTSAAFPVTTPAPPPILPPPPPPFFPLDLTLRLFDETGKEVAIAYDASGPGFYDPNPSLEYIIDTPGTYYIGVSNLGNVTYDPFVEGSGSNYGDSTGSYSLSIGKVFPTQMTGTDAEDTLDGTFNYDLIFGLDGDDTLQALSGDDRIFGGAGDDFILAGDGNDRVFGETDDDLLVGGNGNDQMEGHEGSDRLFGEAGDDRLYGNPGNDRLNGSDGTDLLYGGAGRDHLEGGDSNDKLYGEAGHDTLVGGASDDFLEGGDGNDTLIGVSLYQSFSGYGLYDNDTLTGGAGKDLFILGDRDRVYYDDNDPLFDGTYNAATITDFNAADDRIQLKGTVEQYSLDFYRSATGSINAALVYDAGIDSRGETIAILENVTTALRIKSSAFQFV